MDLVKHDSSIYKQGGLLSNDPWDLAKKSLVDVSRPGNIENWLCDFEKEMQRSVRRVCKRGARGCLFQHATGTHRRLSSNRSSRYSNQVQDLLFEIPQKERLAELDRKKKDIGNIMKELSAVSE